MCGECKCLLDADLYMWHPDYSINMQDATWDGFLHNAVSSMQKMPNLLSVWKKWAAGLAYAYLCVKENLLVPPLLRYIVQ